MARDIHEIRAEIDDTDRALAELFCRRMALSAEIAAYKQTHGLPVLDPAREAEVLAAAADRVEEDLRPYATALFEALMQESRAYQAALLADGQKE